jgi:hypothetical protein
MGRGLGRGLIEINQYTCAIHKCMEATLGISPYGYLYLKLAKTLWLSYYLLCFLFNKIREQEGRTGSAWKCGVAAGVVGTKQWDQTVYTHVSKCKNDKIKTKQINRKLIFLIEFKRELFLYLCVRVLS